MQANPARVSVEDYLAGEAQSPRKHEYVDGEIYAMSGASRRHNLLVANFQGHAWNAARQRNDCQVFGSDMKVQVKARNSYYYPDLSVSCDPSDRHEQYLTQPCFIVEVLSPTTAGIDRREKRLSYATLPSLREYVIVEQDRMRVDVYRRHADVWIVQIFDMPNDTVESPCLGLRLMLADLYNGVELPSGVAEPEPPEYAVIW